MNDFEQEIVAGGFGAPVAANIASPGASPKKVPSAGHFGPAGASGSDTHYIYLEDGTRIVDNQANDEQQQAINDRSNSPTSADPTAVAAAAFACARAIENANNVARAAQAALICAPLANAAADALAHAASTVDSSTLSEAYKAAHSLPKQ